MCTLFQLTFYFPRNLSNVDEYKAQPLKHTENISPAKSRWIYLAYPRPIKEPVGIVWKTEVKVIQQTAAQRESCVILQQYRQTSATLDVSCHFVLGLTLSERLLDAGKMDKPSVQLLWLMQSVRGLRKA